MQQSIDKDQASLQSLMEDFEKKLSDYEDAKVGVETSLQETHLLKRGTREIEFVQKVLQIILDFQTRCRTQFFVEI